MNELDILLASIFLNIKNKRAIADLIIENQQISWYDGMIVAQGYRRDSSGLPIKIRWPGEIDDVTYRRLRTLHSFYNSSSQKQTSL